MKKITKIIYILLLIILLVFIGLVFYMKKDLPKTEIQPNIENASTNNIASEPACENVTDIRTFATPTPVTWFAKLDGCVLSCEGGSFTKITSDSQEKYPRFVGYMKDGNISEKYLEGGLRLKITGELESIGDDYARTIFNNKCVPIIGIKKIEILE